VQELHPALDAWMITEGYGRTMGRPGLDLLRREFCTIAQTAVLDTPRQLHSHLRGALHAGGAFAQVDAVLGVVNPMLSYDAWKQIKELWASVRDGWEAGGR
jgi:4-carboxymuconolactone decarboxylase